MESNVTGKKGEKLKEREKENLSEKSELIGPILDNTESINHIPFKAL